jgi:hypothetical protein
VAVLAVVLMAGTAGATVWLLRPAKAPRTWQAVPLTTFPTAFRSKRMVGIFSNRKCDYASITRGSGSSTFFHWIAHGAHHLWTLSRNRAGPV